jgi:hypothetical protein
MFRPSKHPKPENSLSLSAVVDQKPSGSQRSNESLSALRMARRR